MNTLEFQIPNGYTMAIKEDALDIDTAVKILTSRKRNNYISARRFGQELQVSLKKKIWTCPFCNYQMAATLFDSAQRKLFWNRFVNNEKIREWGTRQICFFNDEKNEIELSPDPVITGKIKCPKCHRISLPSKTKRRVSIEWDKKQIEIKAQIIGLNEILALTWPEFAENTITIELPLFEVVRFNLSTGLSSIQVTSNNQVIVADDITEEPSIWEKGIVHALIQNNVNIGRSIKRIFLECFKGSLPFDKHELLHDPQKYVLMTKFIGYQREFYDAIPFLNGTHIIEKSFVNMASQLHTVESVYGLFEKSSLPKYKSIKKIFFYKTGLMFYLPECEKLYSILNDPNHFCSLLKFESVFSLLAILHQRPLLFEFVVDYKAVRGAKPTILMLSSFEKSMKEAIDYATMNDSARLQIQNTWKNHPHHHKEKHLIEINDDFDDEDELEETLYCSVQRVPFSVPMKTPIQGIENCTIDSFSFVWLRTKNEYWQSGEILKNCLRAWDQNGNPVIVVKEKEKIVAAIEVGTEGVCQIRAYRNSSIAQVPGLPAVYEKWLKRFNLQENSIEERYNLEDIIIF